MSFLDKSIIRECFKTDKELIEKWHIVSGSTTEECVDKTYEDMSNLKIKFYILKEVDQVVGYFGKESIDGIPALTGFFIKPEYRNKEIMKEFWNIVNTEFKEKTFFSGVYKKNIPAVKFLTSNGGKVIIDENGGLLFMFNGEKLCH